MLQKSLVNSTPILTERDMLVALAMRWPGNAGVDFSSTASGDIYLLISDALNLELPHEPLAPWVHQLHEVGTDLCQDAIRLDSEYADAGTAVHKIRTTLLRKKEALLTTVANLWKADEIAAAKKAVADHNAPRPGETISAES